MTTKKLVGVVNHINTKGKHGPFAFCTILNSTGQEVRVSFSLDEAWQYPARHPKRGEIVVCSGFGMKVAGCFCDNVKPIEIDELFEFTAEINLIQEKQKEYKANLQDKDSSDNDNDVEDDIEEEE